MSSSLSPPRGTLRIDLGATRLQSHGEPCDLTPLRGGGQPQPHHCAYASQAQISMGDVDLLHPPRELEQRRHKLKRLVQTPNSFFMDVKCPGCFNMCAYARPRDWNPLPARAACTRPAAGVGSLPFHCKYSRPPGRPAVALRLPSTLLLLLAVLRMRAVRPCLATRRPSCSAAAARLCSASRPAARRG